MNSNKPCQFPTRMPARESPETEIPRSLSVLSPPALAEAERPDRSGNSARAKGRGGRFASNTAGYHGETFNLESQNDTIRGPYRNRGLNTQQKVGRGAAHRRGEARPNVKNRKESQSSGVGGAVGKSSTGSEAPHDRHDGDAQTSLQPQRLHNFQVDPNRVVKRSLPQNGRHFQLLQLQRRFRFDGDTQALDENTEFTLNLVPSDPDFPYPIDVLTFVLTVPYAYSLRAAMPDSKSLPFAAHKPGESDIQPLIRVLNKEIPIGFRINVERGFADIASKASEETTLLDMIKALDKNLETFLAGDKAATIKIIPNVRGNNRDLGPLLRERNVGATAIVANPSFSERPAVTQFEGIDHKLAYAPAYTAEERAAAARQREQDLRQLEARLKGSSLFRKSDDGLVYTLPFEARRKELLPVPLQNLRLIRLRVPPLYDLESCKIDLPGISEDISAHVGRQFEKQIVANKSWSLMAHLNALSANLHTMATTEILAEVPKRSFAKEQESAHVVTTDQLSGTTICEPADIVAAKEEGVPGRLEDKEHIYIIPRPPEWSYADDTSDSGTEYEELSDSEEVDGNADEEGGSGIHDRKQTIERGTSLSFPGIQMSGIELLEVLVLNIVAKCSHCKTQMEITNLRPGGRPRYNRCDKCSNVYGVGFRMELVHENSHRAGFFDLYGCGLTEILPSNFLPHCSSCSSSLPPPGISGLVPGQRFSATCRECHKNMSLLIPEIKLLQITREDVALEVQGKVPIRKKEKDLHIIAGTELPNCGRCNHYRKSTRWFRFSCCLKVYPCDKCHDAQQTTHPAEHANRMICGRCSREQNYRPNDCTYCGHSFIRKYTGYWEGGKGTRDKALLRRNDPRKYKRVRKAASEK